jgi:hypothetical protein
MFGICVFMLKRPPQLFRRNVLATSPGESKPEKLFARVRKSCAHNQSPIAIRLARFKLRAHLSREFFDGANLR